MANGFRGEAEFTASGKTYKIIFDANAFCEMEDALSTPEHQVGMAEIIELVQKGMSMKAFRAVLHGGLSENHPEMSLRDAGKLISDVGFEELGKVVGQAFQRAMPAAEGQSQGNVRAKPAKPGAGKRR